MCPKSVIWARATASGRRRQCQPCRRRRAKGLRTTTDAAPAAADFEHRASMITAFGPDLAAEYPIGPAGVAQNQRYQDGHAVQHEDLAALGRSRLPDGDAPRYDIRIPADAESEIGQRE